MNLACSHKLSLSIKNAIFVLHKSFEQRFVYIPFFPPFFLNYVGISPQKRNFFPLDVGYIKRVVKNF